MAPENDWRRFLLAECLEAYAGLDETERQRIVALLNTGTYQEAKPLMMTTYERGKIEGRRESVLLQLEKKFGPLAAAVRQRVESLSTEQLQQVLLDLIDSRSLKELHLED